MGRWACAGCETRCGSARGRWNLESFEITDLGTPIVAAALHAGHALRAELLPLCALDEETRLREEDPYTAILTDLGTTRVGVNASSSI